ncbi:MAG: glutamate formimidoyltransferase [Methanomassiliicoccales archaeon]|nr:glutamate formimidoyltransferase [Methanomassiliicoccales archaeon]MDD1755989.1 glutamate formimidoyltransferase [Methanomassiliicoccales archaeon]
MECVPNFSEGRRPEVVEAIIESMRSASNVRILDARSDPDHNRTVVTMVGAPADVVEAAFSGIKKAAELIDMDAHKGEHPRIGATDVVPFVPVSGISLEECVPLARGLAERVSRELGIPTYLYEAAATSPDRIDLADLRRGQYEGLREAIRSDPARKPDFGPTELPRAGATVVGAREFLIAYNAYLNTYDVEKAKEIARKIREKGGGFPFVKAMGFHTKPFVQVSMNLTNFRRTPVHEVLDAIRSEARLMGLEVTETEVYGMVPADALFAAAEHELQLGKGWTREQVIERRLEELGAGLTPLRSLSVEQFLDKVASAEPTPGGGSTSCLSSALGASLGAMVCRLTIGKKGYEEAQPLMLEKLERFEGLRKVLVRLIDEDAASYQKVMGAFRLPKGSEEEKLVRSRAIQDATKAAAEVPMRTAALSKEVIEHLLAVAPKCNKNAASDAAVGLESTLTGLLGACLNVEINLASIKDEEFKAQARSKLDSLLAGTKERVEAAVAGIRTTP